MRRILTNSLIAGVTALALSSCETTPKEEEQHKYGQTGDPTTERVHTPTTTPTQDEPTTMVTPSPVIEASVTPVASPTPLATPAVQDYPVANPVDGKPGFVKSPYSESGIVDVRGYPPGTEVRDPYSGKIFLVP